MKVQSKLFMTFITISCGGAAAETRSPALLAGSRGYGNYIARVLVCG